MAIDAIAAPVIAQVYDWIDAAWKAIRDLATPSPAKQLEKADKLRQKGKTTRAQRKEEKARATLKRRAQILRDLKTIPGGG